jgi:DNA-dependent RNA polymerase auxiliary subunit epsilon
MGRTASTEPQRLYKDSLYLTFFSEDEGNAILRNDTNYSPKYVAPVSQEARDFRITSESSGLRRIQYLILDTRVFVLLPASYRTGFIYPIPPRVICRNVCLGMFGLYKRVKVLL